MTSSIQLSNRVKETLATYKRNPRESYEEVIVNLISEIEKRKMVEEALLIEGYKEMAKESLKICKEFEKIEEDFDWEWK